MKDVHGFSKVRPVAIITPRRRSRRGSRYEWWRLRLASPTLRTSTAAPSGRRHRGGRIWRHGLNRITEFPSFLHDSITFVPSACKRVGREDLVVEDDGLGLAAAKADFELVPELVRLRAWLVFAVARLLLLLVGADGETQRESSGRRRGHHFRGPPAQKRWGVSSTESGRLIKSQTANENLSIMSSPSQIVLITQE